MKKTITVLAGNFVHKTTTQFEWLSGRAPQQFEFRIVEGPEALAQLDDTDLFIAAGLYWSGSPTVSWTTPVPYSSPSDDQRRAFRRYVESGKAVLGFHGGIASFDDWPEFATLLGFQWHWSITTHGPVQEYRIYPVGDAGFAESEFTITDENYFNVQIVPGINYKTHLKMDCGAVQLPMLMTSDEERIAGAGRCAYLGLGHDMRAIENPAFEPLFWKTLNWLLQKSQ